MLFDLADVLEHMNQVLSNLGHRAIKPFSNFIRMVRLKAAQSCMSGIDVTQPINDSKVLFKAMLNLVAKFIAMGQ